MSEVRGSSICLLGASCLWAAGACRAEPSLGEPTPRERSVSVPREAADASDPSAPVDGEPALDGASDTAPEASPRDSIPELEVPGLDWLSDSRAWEYAGETVEPCKMYLAKDPRNLWPPIPWGPCGPGCEQAPVIAGDVKWGAVGYATTWKPVGDVVHVSTTLADVGENPVSPLFGIFEYGTGQAVFLARGRGRCTFITAGKVATTLLQFHAKGTNRMVWVDPSSARPLTVLPEGAPWTTMGFDFGSSWGFTEGFSRVFAAPDPLLGEVVALHPSTGFIPLAVGLSEHVLWGEWTDRGNVFAWNREQGTVSLAESENWVPAPLGMSAERFVWIGVTGPRARSGGYETAQFFSCRRKPRLEPCDAEPGPVIPMTSGHLEIAVHGSWAAILGATGEEAPIVFLADLERNLTWKIPLISGRRSQAVAGMSATHLVLRDMHEGTSITGFDGWLRYDLSRVDEYATRL